MKKDLKFKLKSLEKLDIIMVEWVDAEKDAGDGWVSIDEAMPKTSKYVLAQTVGFFVGYNKDILRCASVIFATIDVRIYRIKYHPHAPKKSATENGIPTLSINPEISFALPTS